MTKISIIIATHNRPHLLASAVQSAQAASRRDVEVIVVDDASTDENADIARRLRDVKYIRIECNQGVAGARNVGILASRGEYLSFLDDDDLRLGGSLDKQIDALDFAPAAGLVYGQAILGLENGSQADELYPVRCPQGDVFWELLSQNFVPCGTAVFRRSCLNRVGLLDSSISGIDDWDLWLRIAELYPVLSEKLPVIVWRKSTPFSGQGTSNAVKIVEMSTRRFYQHWMSLPRVNQASVQQRRKISRQFSDNMANHLLWEAVRSALAGQPLRSQKNILAAIRLCPTGVARALLRPRSFRSLLKHAPQEREALKSARTASKRQAVRSRT